MSPNGISSGFDEIFSSDSSDSEFLSQGDVKSRGNYINKQWEAIERTLYQEPGQQVTDPELLKECKLWRETFPHFRVKGTKVEVKKPEKVDEVDKNVQTLEKHFNLKVLEEKRESIKKKVVGILVERLIAKYGSEKQESAKIGKGHSTGVQITEIDDETAEKFSKLSPSGLDQVENSDFWSPAGIEKESYFERGKPSKNETWSPEEGLTVTEVEKKLCEIFDSWTQDDKTTVKLPETAESTDPVKAANSNRENFMLRNSVKSSTERSKPHKFIPPFDSLSSIAKPFEITKKIDKKYDGLIEKIMERQCNGLDPRKHCRTSSSGLQMNCQEPLGRLRIASGFDDEVRKRRLPRLNKLSNPWLDRRELDSYRNVAGDQILQKEAIKSNKAPEIVHGENISQREIDEKFLEELKREMVLNYKRPPKKSGIMEEINLTRPKPFISTPGITVKSSSFGDLTKRHKKEVRGGLPKGSLEPKMKESNVKSRVKSNISNVGKGNKTIGKQNFLPPFDTGIICTELTGRPKIGPKNMSKRF